MKHITHLFPCVFLLPPLESFLLNADVDRSFVVSSGTGKLVAYPCSCSGIRKGKVEVITKYYNKVYVYNAVIFGG